MADDQSISRRTYLKRSFALVGLTIGATVLEGCGKGSSNAGSATSAGKPQATATALNCNDTSSLSDHQKQQRKSAQYVEKTPTAGQRCSNCTHYVAAKPSGTCGTCKVVPGPINPDGYCILYTAG